MNAMRDGNYRSHRRPQPAGRARADRQQRQDGSAGNPQRSYERYLALARETALTGDAVETENWYQHAEHYFRMMRERAT